MLGSKAKRELKRTQRRILIDSIEIGIPSPKQICTWGERLLPNGQKVGEVKNSKTVNYKRFTPLRDGLFCERIFGPVNSFVCACGKGQARADLAFCEKCEVEYTDQRARRYRLGFISLVSPVAHIWYLKGRPSYLSLFLGKRKKTILAIAYCNAYLVEQAFNEMFKANTDYTLPGTISFTEQREAHGLQKYIKNLNTRSIDFIETSKISTHKTRTSSLEKKLVLVNKKGINTSQDSANTKERNRYLLPNQEKRENENNFFAAPLNSTNLHLSAFQSFAQKSNKETGTTSFLLLLTEALGIIKKDIVLTDSTKRDNALLSRHSNQQKVEDQRFDSKEKLQGWSVAKPALSKKQESWIRARNIHIHNTQNLISERLKQKAALVVKNRWGNQHARYSNLSQDVLLLTPFWKYTSFLKDVENVRKVNTKSLLSTIKTHLASTLPRLIAYQEKVQVLKQFCTENTQYFDRQIGIGKKNQVGVINKSLEQSSNNSQTNQLKNNFLNLPLDSLKHVVKPNAQSTIETVLRELNLYTRAYTFPFLPNFVCKYNLRDELLNFLSSSPVAKDKSIPLYCHIPRWQALQDVHQFMSKHLVSQFSLEKAKPRATESNRCLASLDSIAFCSKESNATDNTSFLNSISKTVGRKLFTAHLENKSLSSQKTELNFSFQKNKKKEVKSSNTRQADSFSPNTSFLSIKRKKNQELTILERLTSLRHILYVTLLQRSLSFSRKDIRYLVNLNTTTPEAAASTCVVTSPEKFDLDSANQSELNQGQSEFTKNLSYFNLKKQNQIAHSEFLSLKRFHSNHFLYLRDKFIDEIRAQVVPQTSQKKPIFLSALQKDFVQSLKMSWVKSAATKSFCQNSSDLCSFFAAPILQRRYLHLNEKKNSFFNLTTQLTKLQEIPTITQYRENLQLQNPESLYRSLLFNKIWAQSFLIQKRCFKEQEQHKMGSKRLNGFSKKGRDVSLNFNVQASQKQILIPAANVAVRDTTVDHISDNGTVLDTQKQHKLFNQAQVSGNRMSLPPSFAYPFREYIRKNGNLKSSVLVSGQKNQTVSTPRTQHGRLLRLGPRPRPRLDYCLGYHYVVATRPRSGSVAAPHSESRTPSLDTNILISKKRHSSNLNKSRNTIKRDFSLSEKRLINRISTFRDVLHKSQLSENRLIISKLKPYTHEFLDSVLSVREATLLAPISHYLSPERIDNFLQISQKREIEFLQKRAFLPDSLKAQFLMLRHRFTTWCSTVAGHALTCDLPRICQPREGVVPRYHYVVPTTTYLRKGQRSGSVDHAIAWYGDSGQVKGHVLDTAIAVSDLPISLSNRIHVPLLLQEVTEQFSRSGHLHAHLKLQLFSENVNTQSGAALSSFLILPYSHRKEQIVIRESKTEKTDFSRDTLPITLKRGTRTRDYREEGAVLRAVHAQSMGQVRYSDYSSFNTFLEQKKTLSPLELTTIREILSYTGGGALQKLLQRFDTKLFATFLLADIQSSRAIYKKRATELNCQVGKVRSPSRTEKRILTRLCRRIYKNSRRFKIAQLLTRCKRRPEWMIISILPVLPPDLRPILQMSESVVVASDLNNLYQRVIYRNNRFHKLNFIDFHLVTAIQRLVQDAVDRLVENGKGGSKPFSTPGGRPLKSLSDTLKGKKGRFRLNLLGKRVDFSGRSVIVVSPNLHIHECGLPQEIALELYHYFLLRQFLLTKQASSIIMAKKIIKQRTPFMWDVLRNIIYHHPVLLNRAPTLHRLGIQAFQPRLVSGNAILLNPLVCSGFNADFDGDQMGVHLPLCNQARAEAWDLLWSRNNLLSPATGQPVLVPSQDMVLGFYYMTQILSLQTLHSFGKQKKTHNFSRSTNQPSTDPSAEKEAIASFNQTDSRSKATQLKNVDSIYLSCGQLIQAFQNKQTDIHAPVWLQWKGLVEDDQASQTPLELRINSYGNSTYIYPQLRLRKDENAAYCAISIRTTAGRVLVNSILSR